MIHLGDITKLHGDAIPPVDCITGGSPCQDLSVAGKRAGLAGERSGLFMEQIRIVKEMRNRDIRNGRTGIHVRPRFMVWENVPGAFSSNKGEDFRAVLEEIVKVVEPNAPPVPLPDKGKWPKAGCLYDELGRWSVAWRVHDAQFWGVPQRRKRIALVADFGGLAAPEVLFVREGLSGDPEPRGAAWENAAGEIGGGFDSAIEEPPVDGWYKGTFYLGADTERDGTYPAVARSITRRYDGSPCIDRGPNIVMTSDAEPTESRTRCGADGASAYCLQGNGIDRADTAGCNGRGWREDQSYTLNTIGRPAVYIPDVAHALTARHDGSPQPDKGNGANIVAVHQNASGEVRENDVAYTIGTNANASGRNTPLVYDAREPLCIEMTSTKNTIVEDGISPTLTARMGTGGNQVNAVQTYSNQAIGQYVENDKASYLKQRDYKDATDLIVAAVDCRNGTENPDVNGTLQAKSNGGFSYNCQTVCRTNQTVRRLTPLECERLQGYPSRKTVDVSQMTKDEYIAWNLAEGNIIADQERGKVYGTRGPGGCPYKEPKELKGSGVNGYKVVSIRNGATKLQCRVHRIIWISAHGIIPDGHVIDHINNDKMDNRLENLQLLTPEQNSQKAKADGLYKSGLDNKATKLDPDLKDEIAFLYEYSDLTMRNLAELYGVSKSRIAQIVHEIGWTDIGDWVDSKGKKHKAADSPRYKALGNSIALPFWFWLLRRISAQYERPATLGSLFDGIGGFPLCWERCNGKGTAIWASEIEEFPIAVTKVHFPEEKETT